MLTIFSIPKPFLGHAGVIQRNALRSWTRLVDVEVILFGDDEGVAEAAAEFGARHVPTLERTELGTPYLTGVFETAAEIGGPILCYVNGDIVLPASFSADVALVAEQKRRFLMVGRCFDIDVREELAPDDAFLLEGQERSPFAIDYFAFPRQIRWNLPPFAVGRRFWDTWMLYRARRRRIPLVDATARTTVLHQHHDYAHVPQGTGRSSRGPETDLSAPLLLGTRLAVTGRKFSLRDATYVLTSAGSVVRAPHARGMGRVRAEQRLWAGTAVGHIVFSRVRQVRGKLTVRTRLRRALRLANSRREASTSRAPAPEVK